MLLVTFLLFTVQSHAGGKWVKPYSKKSGAYVEGHYRSKQNSTRFDNYGTKGNYNPYTGTKGTKSPYKWSW